MRAAFNRTMDVTTGPLGTPPNFYLGRFPCRYVRIRRIVPQDLFTMLLAGYVTYDATLLTAAAAGGTVVHQSYDFDFADRVDLQELPGFARLVYMTELVTPRAGAPYYRAWLY
jgi:hypothetical protein